MDKEYLKDILNQTRSLNHMEYNKAERLKKKAADAFRILFGSDLIIQLNKYISRRNLVLIAQITKDRHFTEEKMNLNQFLKPKFNC